MQQAGPGWVSRRSLPAGIFRHEEPSLDCRWTGISRQRAAAVEDDAGGEVIMGTKKMRNVN